MAKNHVELHFCLHYAQNLHLCCRVIDAWPAGTWHLVLRHCARPAVHVTPCMHLLSNGKLPQHSATSQMPAAHTSTA